MIQLVAIKLSSYLRKEGALTSDDEFDVCCYGLECFLASAVQTILLLVAACLLGLLPQALAYSLTFSTLKKRIGGFHAGGQLSCLGLSTGLALVCCWLAGLFSFLSWYSTTMVGSLVLAVGLVLWRAPIIHPNNPKTPEQYRQCRKQAVRWMSLEVAAVLLTLWLLPARLLAVPLAAAFGMLCAALTLLLPVPNEEEVLP